MVSEAHCMSFPYTELLLFNYAKVKTIIKYGIKSIKVTIFFYKVTLSNSR